jgi:glycerol-3-phosphate cytidylyltransferase
MKTVITFGTYDLFHIGHLRILMRARALGDRLVVGVSTDDLNFSKKGIRPVFSLVERMEIIRGLVCVDDVFAEETLELKAEYIKQHKADILVMGNDWQGKFDHFNNLCEVIYLPRTGGISTTKIKEYIGQIKTDSL